MRQALWLPLVTLALSVAAQAKDYDLRYRFTAGESWTYETRATVEGQVSVNAAQREPQALPLAVESIERMQYTVSLVKDDGSAWLLGELKSLQFSTTGFGDGVIFEVRDTGDGAEVRSNQKTWTIDREDPDPQVGATQIGPGLTVGQAAALLEPVKLYLSPGGAVLEQEGKNWHQRLDGIPLLNTMIPLLSPFGEHLPELPAKPLANGTEWRQERTVALPGSDEEYGLEVVSTVLEPRPVGPYETIVVGFQARNHEAGRTFQFSPGPGLAVPMTLESLDHVLSGELLFDDGAGRLVEQRMVSEVEVEAAGQLVEPLLLHATLTVNSTKLLTDVESAPAAG